MTEYNVVETSIGSEPGSQCYCEVWAVIESESGKVIGIYTQPYQASALASALNSQDEPFPLTMSTPINDSWELRTQLRVKDNVYDYSTDRMTS